MDDEQRKQVGDRVRAARLDRGWSQAKLAAEAGVSENTVLSIESAKRAAQGEKLRAVLDALGMASPADGTIDLEGVPEDVRIFIRVAIQRLSILPEDKRAVLLSRAYPMLLSD